MIPHLFFACFRLNYDRQVWLAISLFDSAFSQWFWCAWGMGHMTWHVRGYALQVDHSTQRQWTGTILTEAKSWCSVELFMWMTQLYRKGHPHTLITSLTSTHLMSRFSMTMFLQVCVGNTVVFGKGGHHRTWNAWMGLAGNKHMWLRVYRFIWMPVCVECTLIFISKNDSVEKLL